MDGAGAGGTAPSRRTVGRADETGPLPVDATGPLPLSLGTATNGMPVITEDTVTTPDPTDSGWFDAADPNTAGLPTTPQARDTIDATTSPTQQDGSAVAGQMNLFEPVTPPTNVPPPAPTPQAPVPPPAAPPTTAQPAIATGPPGGLFNAGAPPVTQAMPQGSFAPPQAPPPAAQAATNLFAPVEAAVGPAVRPARTPAPPTAGPPPAAPPRPVTEGPRSRSAARQAEGPGADAATDLDATTAIPVPARPKRRWPLRVLGIAAAIVTGVVVAVALVRHTPGDLIAAAATDTSSWPGTHFVGAVPAGGGSIAVDLTVSRDGASGTLTRDNGAATAEIARDGTGTLIKGNREWWNQQHPDRAPELADIWIADPDTEIPEIAPILDLHPQALAAFLRPDESTSQWDVIEQRQADGQDGLVLADGERRVVITAKPPYRLLGLDIGTTSPAVELVRVSPLTPEEAGTVGDGAGQVRAAGAPLTLGERLQNSPAVHIEMQPEQLCANPTCNVTVLVTNSGTAPARGHLEIVADTAVVSTQPLDVAPGQTATFTATAPNPHFNTPGANGEIRWEAKAVNG